jgi:hypothetical protein
MRSIPSVLSVLSIACALALGSDAGAGPGGGGSACQIGKGIGATSVFYFDVTGDGLWNGTAAGDASLTLAAFAGAGTPILGDWNDDGVDDTGKQVSTSYYLDLNGSRTWDGNAGGDRGAAFASSFGVGLPLVGRWTPGGGDRIGTFVNNVFYLDRNGNGVWNGNAGGDLASGFAAAFVGGVPVIGDWNGDGDDDLGKQLTSFFYLDLNGNDIWDGDAGGDRVTSFAASFVQPPFGFGVPLVGDWDGDGDDEFGLYVDDKFLLDLNGNGIWNGNAGGDANVAFAAFAGPGVPIVCDWDGDGDDDIGKVVGTTFYLDRNGNRTWDGNAGGDRSSNFAIGGEGRPLPGVWSPP